MVSAVTATKKEDLFDFLLLSRHKEYVCVGFENLYCLS